MNDPKEAQFDGTVSTVLNILFLISQKIKKFYVYVNKLCIINIILRYTYLPS